jgi:hypothetical protein
MINVGSSDLTIISIVSDVSFGSKLLLKFLCCMEGGKCIHVRRDYFEKAVMTCYDDNSG